MTSQTEETPPESAEEQEEKIPLKMEVKIDKPSACERHVTVAVAREDVERYLKNAYDELSPKAEVPGFRAGRARASWSSSGSRSTSSSRSKASC